jgi:hypothetical protein
MSRSLPGMVGSMVEANLSYLTTFLNSQPHARAGDYIVTGRELAQRGRYQQESAGGSAARGHGTRACQPEDRERPNMCAAKQAAADWALWMKSIQNFLILFIGSDWLKSMVHAIQGALPLDNGVMARPDQHCECTETHS